MATRSYGDKTYEVAEMSRGHYPEDTSHSRGGNDNYRSGTHDHGAQPRYLSNLARGRTSSFYINGDTFFPSKKVIYNPSQFKDFHNYLDYLTERLVPRFGAVRKICTPSHGGRIQDLGDLQDDGVYVVTGSEKFKPYKYDQIRPSDRRRSPAVNYNVEPVYHNRQFMSSGKIKKVDTQSILIKVWPNGGDLKGPHRVLISPRIRPYTLQNVISHVNELLKEDCLGTVEKLYFLSGSQVSEVEQIIPNGQYVACRRAERFKKARYNDQAVKNLSTSPRLDRKLLVPLFFARSVNGASQLSDQSQTSTQNSVASHTNRRRAPDDDDDDRVFPARPVKYKRDSEKVRTVDLDKDQGRLFKAKQPNHNTRGASEVPDSRRLKTDRPVDQWEAQEVDEDVSKRKDTRKTLSQRNGARTEAAESTKPRQKPSTRSKDAGGDSDEEVEQSVMKIQAGYRGYKTRQEMRVRDAHKPSGSSGNKTPYAYNTSDREKSSSEDRFNEENAAARIQAGYRGHQTRKTEDEKKAATKIQSSFRGYQDRKDLASRQEEPASNTNAGRLAEKADKTATKLQDKGKGQAAPRRQPSPQDREDSYDELDKENNAALTIQSHYRGYRTRQGVASRRSAAN